MRVGILSLQGDVAEHREMLKELGVEASRVSVPRDLEGLDGIVLPGGESTTLSKLLVSSGLFEPLALALRSGLPAFGTCAGLVLLSSSIVDGRDDQLCFGVLDCKVRRNGYGRQRESFEAVIETSDLSGALGQGNTVLPAVFIRAPIVEQVGSDVKVLASFARRRDEIRSPVVCVQGNVLATTFHPELTRDVRVHELFMTIVESSNDRTQRARISTNAHVPYGAKVDER